ncbi:MAG: ATP-dependent zinc metalloprotease FtsH [Lachnospiraceae bacterium]|nr:ATP-dependent zinc metalloprotease FtsH [Lachnospiraceae bacterium]MBP5254093.1 ATP-dependent zinc metalloprotease FtsH [Lachnospiraceae bacterium]
MTVNQENEKRPVNPAIFYLLFIAVLVLGAFFLQRFLNSTTPVAYTEYEKDVADGKVLEARIEQNREVPTGKVVFTLKDGTDTATYSVNVADVVEEKQKLKDAGIPFSLTDVPGEDILLTLVLPTVLLLGGFLLIFVLMNRRLSAGAGGANAVGSFTKSRARVADAKENVIRFRDVAGMDEEKEELAEVVDFLENPGKYMNLGARIPKGILLVGPPGTGKTLLAKAVAGEAGVPFFTISGSDFVELFVGVGAGRVRDLFEQAKRNAPCIVFIDEIDAVARIRGTGIGGGQDEREQTLNQLLVEMDGFTVNQGIIVLAATNRGDILDPAILRPGRFDRKVAVSRPDIKGREAILKVHSRNKKLGDDVDLSRIARTTAGFSGADLENLMNEAAINAAKASREFITEADIETAFIKVGIGKEKKSRVISEEEKRITAYHEMGHAVLFHVLPDMGPVHTVSIIPTGIGAAGYTMPLPERDDMYLTRSRMRQTIQVAMGGRIAEELVFGDITTGASQDIVQATEVARDMVMKYGMSDKVGFLNYEQQQREVFLGRDLGQVKTYGAEIYNLIEEEVRKIIDECYASAKAILTEKRAVLDAGAALLMEKEKIGTEEFEALYRRIAGEGTL